MVATAFTTDTSSFPKLMTTYHTSQARYQQGTTLHTYLDTSQNPSRCSYPLACELCWAVGDGDFQG